MQTLSKQGEEQELQVTIRFRTVHSPGSDFHLKKLLQLSDTYIKASDVVEEDGRLIIYV